ncbi:hypothetical protein F503_07882 [Ophiostoma piceae UAMH 11346]|uniref:RNase MRP protein 1 RNA binding domain-containing protein n=1 Tax=Ophiostoma piceae (strain UAMH 11346) TaxID=1262450 RepID=S3C5W5_OPHP1|nr:hypothetical protein F503_07882 [Ophiostoma piceae UAMH 11346]
MATKQISTKRAVAPPPPPPTQTASFSGVAEHLDDTAVLLHGLHRRHKNQHRVSTYWWPSFGQLRRAVTRLLEDVQNADKAHGIKRITSRVGDTRALVPKVYLAFSRLVADKQFAPLGLLLVGVLAQVQSAVNDIERILGIAADAADAANSKTGAKTAAPPTSASRDTGKQSASRSLPDIDFGVAVSRDDETGGNTAKSASVSRLKKRARKDDSEEDVPKLAAASAPGTAATLKSTDKHGPKPHAEKKRKIVEDQGRTITEHEDVKATTENTKPAQASEPGDKETKEMTEKNEKKKDKSRDKKKKRKRGDEFDDLFSGLL